MNAPTDTSIVIPAAIAALPGLNLSERVALAHVAKFPGCSNRSLAKLLGVSVRGAENILRRLRDEGHIHQVGKGRARRHDLAFPVEQHTLCGKSNCDESHIKCAVEPSSVQAVVLEMSTQDFAAMRLSFYETCCGRGEYALAQQHLEAVRARVEQAVDVLPEDKAALLTKLKRIEDQCFAFTIGAKVAEGLPNDVQKKLALTLCRASADKLALLREKVESGATFGGGKGVLGLIGEHL
jgi:DNA-binding Lrp family transcriptional regulator